MASIHDGMGSMLFAGGTAFRVWAPFARRVEVALYDNPNQNPDQPSAAHDLDHELDGYWSVDVPDIVRDQFYRYRITNRDTGATFTKIDPYSRQVTNSNGLSIVREAEFPWTDDGFVMADMNSLVIYEMHLGSFDDDPGNKPGNLTRARARLGQLKEMGINCIHIMPPCEFANDFSWGFNVALPFAIEEAYGGINAFKAFVNRAHELEIAVMVDCLFNHLGGVDARGLEACLDRFDGWYEDSHHGIYFYNDGREYTDWGPRPDFGREEVRQYIHDYALYLMGECHCDGLRIDSTCNIWGFNNGQGWNPEGFNLLRWIADEKNRFFRRPKQKVLIAEDWHNDGWVTRPTPQNGAGMDSEWSGLVHDIRAALTPTDDSSRDLNRLANGLYARFNDDAFKRVIFSESHDESGNDEALARKIDPGNPDSWFARKRTTLGAALVLTAPGIPMIWQGQEIHSTIKFRDDSPLDWSRLQRFGGIYDLYRDLCRLRRNWFNNTRGLRGQHINCHVIDGLNKILALHRWSDGGPGDDVVAIFNFSYRNWDHYRVGLPRWGQWWCRFSSDWHGYSNDFQDFGGNPVSAEGQPWNGMDQSASFAIGAYSAVIYSQ